MIIIDRILEQRESKNNPIRVGMVGAGFMGSGIALQILNHTKGMRLVAIANHHVEKAEEVYRKAGAGSVRRVLNGKDLEASIGKEEYAVCDDPMLLCCSERIDAIIEVTGAVEYGAHVAMEAIRNGKHVALMNAELDSTLGPVLKAYADQAGVVVTNVDGDQPGVIMNLYRFVRGIGVRPVLCGNIKGLQDPYRNPTTQEGFARKWGQNVHMVTSFADGSKISFEQSIVANATGMRVAKRGMYGPAVEPGTPIEEAVSWYPHEVLLQGAGIVDYVVGADPGPGVFVLGTHDDPAQKHYLNLYKLGEGPLYCFYRPYHLCHFEVPNTLARAVLFGDATITPAGPPMVDVIATAKADLKAGQVLDGIGGYTTYGQCENAEIVGSKNLLPMGLMEGCQLVRDVAKDEVLRYEDVQLPKDRLCDRLRVEQNERFNRNTGTRAAV